MLLAGKYFQVDFKMKKKLFFNICFTQQKDIVENINQNIYTVYIQ